MASLHQQYLIKYYRKQGRNILSKKLSPPQFATNQTKIHLELEARVDYDGLIKNFLNNNGFTKILQRELKLARRRKEITGVLLALDIDKLKRFNDTKGHVAGDKLIKVYAKVINLKLRDTDLKGRLGGDEFAAFLVNAKVEDAQTIAERIRIGIIEEVKRVFPDLEWEQTISIGITQIQESDNVTSLRERADQALYRAKEDRNEIVVI